MEKIASFSVDHTKLKEGLYLSRLDTIDGVCLSTFDIRMVVPNSNKIMTTGCIHTIEHLGATFLRNDPEYKDNNVYFGPMGCRTGFYVILGGSLKPFDIMGKMQEMFEFVVSFEGDIPGASAVECGNYKDMDLSAAKLAAKEYLDVLNNLTEENTAYPKEDL